MKTIKPIEDSKQIIESFFNGDLGYITTFISLCIYAYSIDNRIIIRNNNEIIGVSLPDSVYHFYMSYIDGIYYIKFKHKAEKELFKHINLEEYKKNCSEVIALINENPKYKLKTQEPKQVSDKPKVKETQKQEYKKTVSVRWNPIKDKLKNAPENCVYSQEETDRFYERISACFAQCIETSTLPDRGKDVLKKRIIDQKILQVIADDYELSRERIRQLVVKYLRRITANIKYDRYDETLLSSIEDAFLTVPDINLIAAIVAIVAIKDKNNHLWDFYENLFVNKKSLDGFNKRIESYVNSIKSRELTINGFYKTKSTGEIVEIKEINDSENMVVKYKGTEYLRPKNILKERFVRIKNKK